MKMVRLCGRVHAAVGRNAVDASGLVNPFAFWVGRNTQ